MLQTQTQRVITEYTADTTDHVDGVRKLEKATRDASTGMVASFKEAIASLGELNGTVEKGKRVWGDMSHVLGEARALISSYGEHSRLVAATASVDMDALAKSVRGLKTEHELMAEAAKMSHGMVKLSTGDIIIAEQAMLGLTKRGFDAAQVTDAVTSAVVGLKDRGLKELGIYVDKTGISMETEAGRGEMLHRILEKLTVASNEFSTSQLSASQNVTKMANHTEDMLEKVEHNAGHALALAANGIEAWGIQVAKWIGGPNHEDSFAYHIEKHVLPYLELLRKESAALAITDPYQRLKAVAAIQIERGGTLDAKTRFALYGAEYKTERLPDKAPEVEHIDTGPQMSEAERALLIFGELLSRTSFNEGFWGGGPSSAYGLGRKAESGDAFDIHGARMPGEEFKSATAGLALPDSGLGALAQNDNSNLLGADVTKGMQSVRLTQDWNKEIGEIDGTKKFIEGMVNVTSETKVAQKAFEGFADAVGAGYEAMVTGTQSFGSAFKHAMGAAVMASGKSMVVEAVKETALGIGSLALGPFGGVSAAEHFHAAAAFAGGAALAGVVAHELGAGGSSGAGGGAGAAGGAHTAAPVAANSNSSSGGTSTVVMIVGDPHDTETNSRRREENAKRIVRNVMGDAAGGPF